FHVAPHLVEWAEIAAALVWTAAVCVAVLDARRQIERAKRRRCLHAFGCFFDREKSLPGIGLIHARARDSALSSVLGLVVHPPKFDRRFVGGFSEVVDGVESGLDVVREFG